MRKAVRNIDEIVSAGIPDEIVLKGDLQHVYEHHKKMHIGAVYYDRAPSGSVLFHRRKDKGNTIFFNGGVGGSDYIKPVNRIEDIDFSDDDDDIRERCFVVRGASSENLVTSFIKAPFRAIRGVRYYLQVDQEKEGREAGINEATKQYEPILRKVRERYEKLKRYDNQRSENYEARCDVLEKLFVKYTQDIEVLSRKIDTLKQNSPESRKFLTDIGYVGIGRFSSGGVATGAARAFGTNTSTLSRGLSSLVSPMAVASSLFIILGVFLDSHNQKKYNKYFEIAYKETAVKYQNDIDEEKNKITQIIQNIKRASKNNDNIVNELEQSIHNAIQKYVELNAILGMIGGL